MGASSHYTQDWEQFDPGAYLNEYYADLGSENLALLRFLVETYRDLPSGGRLLDFGGGPAIYPLITAARHFDEMHFSDYLESNLDEVRRWISGHPAAFDWSEFIRTALEMESGKPATQADIDERVSLIRARVTRVFRCDASRTPPIEGSREPYDVVLTNFCAESATADRWQWQAYMASIVSVLKPGGSLVLSALRGATRYAVGSWAFPAVEIFEEDLIDVLEEFGFPAKGIEIRSVPADRPTRDYQGLMFAVARKAPARRAA